MPCTVRLPAHTPRCAPQVIACLQPADYEAVDTQIREMDAAEGSGNAAFSPLEPLTLEALRQARKLMLRTLLHNRSVRPDLHTHVLFYGVCRGGMQELTAMLMPAVTEFAQLRLLREISAAAAEAAAGAPAAGAPAIAAQAVGAPPSPAAVARIEEARRGGMSPAALAELIAAHVPARCKAAGASVSAEDQCWLRAVFQQSSFAEVGDRTY